VVQFASLTGLLHAAMTRETFAELARRGLEPGANDLRQGWSTWVAERSTHVERNSQGFLYREELVPIESSTPAAHSC